MLKRVGNCANFFNRLVPQSSPQIPFLVLGIAHSPSQLKDKVSRNIHTSNRLKMRAQVLESFNTPYKLLERSQPSNPKGHDLLVEVLAASYCHTDAVFASGAMWQDLPRVGSHEFAGKIVAMGPDVSSSLGLSQGQMVGVPGRAYHPCGSCYECTHNDKDPKGYGVWCNRAGNLGLSRDGGFQEVCLVDSRQVAPMPDALEAVETAPLMCAGLTIWNALERAGGRNEKGRRSRDECCDFGSWWRTGSSGCAICCSIGVRCYCY